MSKLERIDRYLAIVAWARKRYAQGGQLITFRGFTPSTYTRIEDAAAAKLLGTQRRYA